jgi:UDP-3-O-[3-hydroxymyristoyl] N-acetylglucosamine deacetylase/3-hydroxyacyl-[acyl-carrier-protein] dehydratase
MPRRTLASEVTLSGVALHSGATSRVTCRPAPGGQGITFTQHGGRSAAVAARPHRVGATERRTGLGEGDDAIYTVEHLLAAAFALGLDDIAVEVDGPELPILDGSFEPWLKALASAGVSDGPGHPVCFVVRTPFALTVGGASYRVAPADEFRLTVSVEWDHPVIGRQSGEWAINADTFGREIAGARTFGFESEVAELRSRGFALGGAVENVIVLSDDGVVGTTLRWPDEFVRHKAGDVIGDIALIGGRLKAHITADRPSHQGNVALAQRLIRTAERQGGHVLEISRIMEILPHRYPFLLVDRILEVEPERRVVGIKNVTINEPFFQGHFPGHPIMPGVLVIEALAQTGCVLLMDRQFDPLKHITYFMALDNVKFRRPVVPGDQLRLEVTLMQARGRTWRLKGEAYVEGQLATEAEMLARVVDR